MVLFHSFLNKVDYKEHHSASTALMSPPCVYLRSSNTFPCTSVPSAGHCVPRQPPRSFSSFCALLTCYHHRENVPDHFIPKQHLVLFLIFLSSSTFPPKLLGQSDILLYIYFLIVCLARTIVHCCS